jgi:hypothetical protein
MQPCSKKAAATVAACSLPAGAILGGHFSFGVGMSAVGHFSVYQGAPVVRPGFPRRFRPIDRRAGWRMKSGAVAVSALSDPAAMIIKGWHVIHRTQSDQAGHYLRSS